MIGEMRAMNRDFDARRHFTEEKKAIMDARGQVAEWTAPDLGPPDLQIVAAKSAMNLKSAADNGLFDVG